MMPMYRAPDQVERANSAIGPANTESSDERTQRLAKAGVTTAAQERMIARCFHTLEHALGAERTTFMNRAKKGAKGTTIVPLKSPDWDVRLRAIELAARLLGLGPVAAARGKDGAPTSVTINVPGAADVRPVQGAVVIEMPHDAAQASEGKGA